MTSGRDEITEGIPENRRCVHAYHWLQNRFVQNLGDYLGVVVLKELGFNAVSYASSSHLTINPGRCLLPIGSVLWNRTFEHISTPTDVWGCGWRGQPLRPELRERISFHAARGPETVHGLGLPSDTPQGDPVLLLPYLIRKPIPHGKTIVIPHYHRTEYMKADERLRRTGCDTLVSSKIIGNPVGGMRPSPRGIGSMLNALLMLGIPICTGRQAVNVITGADFVLTGSLHGAILAQAYDIPWAAYDDGYIDTPAKWEDWASYLQIRIDFVHTVRAGVTWWNTHGRHGQIQDVGPLLQAFPYPGIKHAYSSI